MSNRIQNKEKEGSTPPFLMKIGGDEIKLEQIILQNINAIQMTGFSSVDLFDAIKANSMYVSLVLNLNDLISGFFKSIENPGVDTFFEKRTEIFEKWKKFDEQGTGKTPIVFARELYQLIIETISNQGMFNVRKYSYFGVGWKKIQVQKAKEEILVAQEREMEDQNTG